MSPNSRSVSGAGGALGRPLREGTLQLRALRPLLVLGSSVFVNPFLTEFFFHERIENSVGHFFLSV